MHFSRCLIHISTLLIEDSFSPVKFYGVLLGRADVPVLVSHGRWNRLKDALPVFQV